MRIVYSMGGEASMSYFTQMLGLAIRNFLSAATGFTRHSMQTIGNFWADIYRITVYLRLPLSIVLLDAFFLLTVALAIGYERLSSRR